MITLDAPDVYSQPNADMVAPKTNTATQPNHAIGICLPVTYRAGDPNYYDEVNPEGDFRAYFYNYGSIEIPKDYVPVVKLLSSPLHGKIADKPSADGSIYRSYVPDLGYIGDDKVIYQVSYQGKTVRVVYVLKVTKLFLDNTNTEKLCPPPFSFYWKISSIPAGSNPTTIIYSNLFNIGFKGANAVITLKVNAANSKDFRMGGV